MSDCPDCKASRCMAHERGASAEHNDITICRLRSQLAAALARAEEAELENRAWRALVAGCGPQLLIKRYGDGSGRIYLQVYRDDGEDVCGEGQPIQAAAIDLAAKLNLLNPESGANGEGGGEG